MKKFWLIFPALLIAGLVMTGCPNDTTSNGGHTPGDITWTLTADGDKDNDTTKITITLSRSADLSGDGVVEVSTGNVTCGDITGQGTSWEIPITAVIETDDVSVTITKAGIEAGPKEVMVHKAGMEDPAATYTVLADGAAGTVSSAKITFTFDKDISELELEADDITFTPDGIVTKGALTETSDPKVWELAITAVSREAKLTVTINKFGITHIEHTVQVYFNIADFYNISSLAIDSTYMGDDPEGDAEAGRGQIRADDFTAINAANRGSFLRITIDTSGANSGVKEGSVIGAVGNLENFDPSRNLSIVWPAEGNTVDLPLTEIFRYIPQQILNDFLYVNVWDGVKITKVELYAKKTADEEPDKGEGVFALIGIPSGGKGKIGYADYLEITATEDGVLWIYIEGGSGKVGSIGSTGNNNPAETTGLTAGKNEILVSTLTSLGIKKTTEIVITLSGGATITKIELRVIVPPHKVTLDNETTKYQGNLNVANFFSVLPEKDEEYKITLIFTSNNNINSLSISLVDGGEWPVDSNSYPQTVIIDDIEVPNITGNTQTVSVTKTITEDANTNVIRLVFETDIDETVTPPLILQIWSLEIEKVED